MLELTIEASESFDPRRSKIVRHPEIRVSLEHSLLAISKWESIWEIPFLGREQKTQEQLASYVIIMSDGKLTEEDLLRFTEEDYEKIRTLLNRKYTATYFSDSATDKGPSQIVTSELLYYWMTANNIPFECERWHISRLMTLIRVAAIKNNPEPQKNGRVTSQILSERAALNKKRREELGTTG